MTTPSAPISLAQARLSMAYRTVEKVDLAHLKKFTVAVKKFPVRARVSGLLQTLAFLQAKSKEDANRRLVESLNEWFKDSRIGMLPRSENSLLTFLLAQEDVTLHRRALAEAIAFVQELGRFAEAKNIENGAKQRHAEKSTGAGP